MTLKSFGFKKSIEPPFNTKGRMTLYGTTNKNKTGAIIYIRKTKYISDELWKDIQDKLQLSFTR